jgi:predicted ATPase
MGAKTNVGAAASSLVGRTAERDAIARFFDDGARLVTVLGPGGVGKTRLATAFAHDHAAAYTAHGGGGAWFCDLTDARSAMAISAVVATTLGLRLDRATGEPDVLAALGRALARRRRLLLVLDNCEHIAAQAATAITTWQELAPHLHCVATSRRPLTVPGEQLWPLEGLGAEAVELFVKRARQVRPELVLGPDELAAIAEIVRRLDGLPLAIELAAARIRVLSPVQIRDRLALGLLVQAGNAGKHGSMRGTVLDSVASLAPDARAVFAGCAVFRGGFTVAAAESVLAAPGRDVLAQLDALCAHSLLRTQTARFQLFEPIREVAAELLAAEPDVRAQLVARHAAYYAHVEATFDELENLVEAHAAAPFAIALALDPLLATRGMFRLRLRLLDGAIAASVDDAAAYIARGQAHRELSNLPLARADFERGLALARDASAAAHAELLLGELIEIDGGTADARASYERALARLAAAPTSREVQLRQAGAAGEQ